MLLQLNRYLMSTLFLLVVWFSRLLMHLLQNKLSMLVQYQLEV